MKKNDLEDVDIEKMSKFEEITHNAKIFLHNNIKEILYIILAIILIALLFFGAYQTIKNLSKYTNNSYNIIPRKEIWVDPKYGIMYWSNSNGKVQLTKPDGTPRTIYDDNVNILKDEQENAKKLIDEYKSSSDGEYEYVR